VRRRGLIEIKGSGFFLIRGEEIEKFGGMGGRERKRWRRKR